jgi:hypothetical protein
MSTANLKILLEYLFEKTNTNVFGNSFNDPDKKRPISDPPEKNTPEEQKFVDKLDKWFNSHLVASSLNNFADEIARLMPLVRSGKYPELTPPSGNVYRGMTLTLEQLKNFLGLEEFTIKAGEYKVIKKGGVLTPQKIKYYKAGKPISSWSTDAREAAHFALSDGKKLNGIELNVVFIANTNDSANNFILNPDKLLKSYVHPITKYVNEKEVLGIGPVNFNSVIVFSKVDVVPEESPAAETKKLLDAAFNDIVNEINASIQDTKSEISKAAQKLSLRSPSNMRKVPLVPNSDPSHSILANGIYEIIKRNAEQYNLKTKKPIDALKQLKNRIISMHTDRAYEGISSLSSVGNIAAREALGSSIRYALGDKAKKYLHLNPDTLAKKASRKRA